MKNEKNMIDTAYRVGRSLGLLQKIKKEIVVQQHEESLESAKDNSIIDFAMTSIFLYALIVELTIKGLWSYENCGKEHQHTHNIANIYSKLEHSTQTQIKIIYDSSCKYYTQVISKGEQQLGGKNIQVEMASLVEALEWNEEAMVNFKYDLTPRGKTIPAGVIWDCETIEL